MVEMWWYEDEYEGEYGGNCDHVCGVMLKIGWSRDASNEGVGLCWPDNTLLSGRNIHSISGVVLCSLCLW